MSDDYLPEPDPVFVVVDPDDLADPAKLTDMVREAELQRMIEQG